MFAVEGRRGRGEVQVSVVGGGKESRTFFIDQQNFLLSLSLFSPLAGLGLEPWCGPVEGYHSREGRAGVSTNNHKKCPLQTVDKPDLV